MSKDHDLDLTIYMSDKELKDLKEELGEAYKEMAKFSEELCKKFKSCSYNKIKLCRNLAEMYAIQATDYAENEQTHSWFQACQSEATLERLAHEWRDDMPSTPMKKYPVHILSANGGMYHFYMLFWEFKWAHYQGDGHPELEVVKGCIGKGVQA